MRDLDHYRRWNRISDGPSSIDGDEIAGAVLALVRGLVDDHKRATGTYEATGTGHLSPEDRDYVMKRSA